LKTGGYGSYGSFAADDAAREIIRRDLAFGDDTPAF